MSVHGKNSSYTLAVTLDASGIEGFEPDRKVKVLAVPERGESRSATVELDEAGKGTARFDLDETPGAVKVYVGPADAADEELPGLQTIARSIPARRWDELANVILPVAVTPHYWWWWRRWCRTFVARGRVQCPDGSAVPGAEVCAFDVDAWWWWTSLQQVGCAVTDVDGTFEIRFRWCCGWWPWWWWRWRFWRLEPFLVERILPELQRLPEILKIPLPDPVPKLSMFRDLLGDEAIGLSDLRAIDRPLFTGADIASKPAAVAADCGSERLRQVSGLTDQVRAQLPTAAAEQRAAAAESRLVARLREQLVARLPAPPSALSGFYVWPWWPHLPWWDCRPDLIFRVSQNCGAGDVVIVDEDYADVRHNVDPVTEVTLVANDSACCVTPDPDDDPAGVCAVLTDLCDAPLVAIGGNDGAPSAPVGYLNPGDMDNRGDRPFGGTLVVQGHMGSDVDYYEPLVSADNGLSWAPLPTSALGGITRWYYVPATQSWVAVPFLHTVDGRRVYESRVHYEASHDPGSWGHTRYWAFGTYGYLVRWLTTQPFLNGTYRLRLRGWQRVGDELVNPTDPLPTCGVTIPAEVVVQIDNRLVGAGSGHPPSVPSHPCGAGTVHTCTLEPDTDFVAVRIVHADASEVPVDACGNVPIGPGDVLEVDFFAHDPEGHLAYYTLQATYGENQKVNLLAPSDVPSVDMPGFGLSSLAGLAVPAAVQVGPDYAVARSDQGAVAPEWKGGGLRLRVKALEAFPETCCYQLELRAHKRTVVNCSGSLWNHTNYSEYSFLVVVNPVPILTAESVALQAKVVER